MNKQITDIVAYLSWPGLLIAFLLGDRYASRFHLNQSLVIWLAATVIGIAAGWIPLFGWLVRAVVGLFCACAGSSASSMPSRALRRRSPYWGRSGCCKNGKKGC